MFRLGEKGLEGGKLQITHEAVQTILVFIKTGKCGLGNDSPGMEAVVYFRSDLALSVRGQTEVSGTSPEQYMEPTIVFQHF